MPLINTETMNAHLAEIASTVSSGAHAILDVDGAGWHTSDTLKLPDTISLLKLPPYAPELNPDENLWEYLRRSKLSQRLRNT